MNGFANLMFFLLDRVEEVWKEEEVVACCWMDEGMAGEMLNACYGVSGLDIARIRFSGMALAQDIFSVLTDRHCIPWKSWM